ncbi:tyrosine-type recombinase/integrase [Rhodococcoides fascians]|uniref:tyrosine-type recombinase/integrase n=1 Tax=Rhodococcoides fascians TaxID=1828 RepID=UPI000564ED8F|nr:site-specific integrase [Rhodococcus fascians]
MITAGKPYKRTSDNLWVVPIYLPPGGDGKRTRKTVARKNRNLAIKAAQLRVRELQDISVTVDPKMTLTKWLDHWTEKIIPTRGLRPNTVGIYEQMIRNQIKPTIGGYKLIKLGPTQVREMHAKLLDQGLSLSTAKLAHTVLQVALDDAEKDEILARNPAKIVGKPKGDTESRGSLTIEQAHHMIETAVTVGDPMAARWALALITGARQGECIGLEWNRVDFDNNEIDLSWAMSSIGEVHGCLTTAAGLPSCGAPIDRPSACDQRRPNITRGFKCKHLRGPLVLAAPKTESSRRIITMLGPIREALLHQYDNRIDNEFGLVWVGPRKRLPVSPEVDRTNWKNALKRAGLPDLPLHSARHTAATLMQSMGVPDPVRMEIMGHNSEAMAKNYAHGRNIQLTGDAINNLGKAVLGTAFSRAKHPALITPEIADGIAS